MQIRSKGLPQAKAPPSGAALAGSVWPAARRSTARAWASASLVAVLAWAPAAGCGHANAPCPTPVSTLDAHRQQSEALQRDLGQTSEAASALEARREEAAARIQAAKALEDSLARAGRPAPTPPHRKTRR